MNGEVIAAVWMDKEIVAIQTKEDGPPLGIALDIGTTTVALYLCDLQKEMSSQAVPSRIRRFFLDRTLCLVFHTLLNIPLMV